MGNMDKLFLIKPNFQDPARGTRKKYFCPPCTLLEGVLSFYPFLREKIEVHYVNYQRPRPEVIKLIGEENQSCPVLIHPDGSFIKDHDQILDYLAANYGIGYAH